MYIILYYIIAGGRVGGRSRSPRRRRHEPTSEGEVDAKWVNVLRGARGSVAATLRKKLNPNSMQNCCGHSSAAAPEAQKFSKEEAAAPAEAERQDQKTEAEERWSGEEQEDHPEWPPITSVCIRGVTLTDRAKMEDIVRAMRLELTRAFIKKEPGTEEATKKEPGTEEAGAAAALRPKQVYLIRQMSRGCGKFDPSREPRAAEEWCHLTTAVPVRDLRFTHDDVSNRFLHGPGLRGKRKQLRFFSKIATWGFLFCRQ